MKLSQIKYFLQIAESKTITKAASELFISQPALSKQMTLLEKEIGAVLFIRATNGIVLTEAGSEFAKDCKKILNLIEDSVEKAKRIHEKEPNEIRIGLFDGMVIDDFMPDLYGFWDKNTSGKEIIISRNSMQDNFEKLENDKLDMVVCISEKNKVKLNLKEGYEKLFLTSRKGAFIYSAKLPCVKKSGFTITDLKNEKLLSVKRKDLAGIFGGKIEHVGVNVATKMFGEKPEIEEVENILSLMTNIKYGKGYTILSKLVADTDPSLLSYELPEEFDAEIYAIWKKSNLFVNRVMKLWN
ncbi:MAG: LysR family transcriptional regulator [Eubacterium sp.]|nr:LysR family transcriptional regulator [Eubacterium sp.]